MEKEKERDRRRRKGEALMKGEVLAYSPINEVMRRKESGERSENKESRK